MPSALGANRTWLSRPTVPRVNSTAWPPGARAVQTGATGSSFWVERPFSVSKSMKAGGTRETARTVRRSGPCSSRQNDPASAIMTRERLQSAPRSTMGGPAAGGGAGRKRERTRMAAAVVATSAKTTPAARRRQTAREREPPFLSSRASTSLALAGRRRGSGSRQSRQTAASAASRGSRGLRGLDPGPRRGSVQSGRLPSRILVQHDAEGPDVRSLALLDAGQALGRQVPGRPGQVGGDGGLAELAGEPEVRDDEAAVGHAEDVLGLEVPVHEPGPVDGGQARDHAARVGQLLLERAVPSPLAQGGPQRAGDGILHDEQATPLGLEDVVDPADVRVPDGSPETKLAVELLGGPRPRPLGRFQDLQRDPELRALIEGPVHDAATATPQLQLDEVPVREQLAGREADVGLHVGSARRRLVQGLGLA